MELSFIQDENAVELIDGITYEFPYTMHERDLSSRSEERRVGKEC